MPLVIPPTTVTDKYSDTGAFVVPVTEAGGVPYVGGYLTIVPLTTTQVVGVFLSLLVGSAQGEAYWQEEIPVPPGIMPLTISQYGETKDILYGARARNIVAGQQASISGALYSPGEILLIPQSGGGNGGPFGGTQSPLTTKGDIWGFSTINDRIPVGPDGQFLTANSAVPLGVSWTAGSGGAQGTEIGYDQITAGVVVNSTTEAAGTTIIAGTAHTFDGSLTMVEFFSPQVFGPHGDSLFICLFEGSTEIGRIAMLGDPSTTFSNGQSVTGRLRFTPSAGSHTYTVTSFCGSIPAGTPQVFAGAGGTGAFVPTFVRYTKV